MSSPNDNMLLIGAIAAPFGVRGQVKLRSYTDRPDHVARHVRTLYLGDERAPYSLTRIHEHKPGILLLSLREVDSREAAEELRGREVFIRADEAAPLAEDEYFIHDLIGLEVLTVAGETVGRVRDVLSTGASDVLIISRPGQAEAMIPIVRDFIAELNIAGGRIVVSPIEGLL